LALDVPLSPLSELGGKRLAVRGEIRSRQHKDRSPSAEHFGDQALDQVVVAPSLCGAAASRIDSPREATPFRHPEPANATHHGKWHEFRKVAHDLARLPGTLQFFVRTCVGFCDQGPRRGMERSSRQMFRIAFEDIGLQSYVAPERLFEAGSMVSIRGEHQRNRLISEFCFEGPRDALVESVEIHATAALSATLPMVYGMGAAAAAAVVLERGIAELPSERFLETRRKFGNLDGFESLLVTFEESDVVHRQYENTETARPTRRERERSQRRIGRNPYRFRGREWKAEDLKPRIGRPESGTGSHTRGRRGRLFGESRQRGLGSFDLRLVRPQGTPALEHAGYHTRVTH
jgi:hypothetical protein